MPITFCLLPRQFHQSVAEGRRTRDLSFAAIDAIIAEVFRRGLFSVALLMLVSQLRVPEAPIAIHASSTRIKWFFSRASRNGTPHPIRVSAMIMRGCAAGCWRAASNAAATAAMSLPSTRCVNHPNACQFFDERFERHDLRRGAVGLLVVDVDDSDQVVELPVARGHDAFPDRAFVQFAVGEQRVHERFRSFALEPETAANRDRQAVAERAAGHLHAGRIARHAGHWQTAVVAAVRFEFFLRAGCLLRAARHTTRSRSARWTAGSGRGLPTRDLPGDIAWRRSKRRRAHRRCRAPGRYSPGPALHPSTGHSCGYDKRVRQEPPWARWTGRFILSPVISRKEVKRV